MHRMSCDLVSLGRAGGPNVGSETTFEDAGQKDSGLLDLVPGFRCVDFCFPHCLVGSDGSSFSYCSGCCVFLALTTATSCLLDIFVG